MLVIGCLSSFSPLCIEVKLCPLAVSGLQDANTPASSLNFSISNTPLLFLINALDPSRHGAKAWLSAAGGGNASGSTLMPAVSFQDHPGFCPVHCSVPAAAWVDLGSTAAAALRSCSVDQDGVDSGCPDGSASERRQGL